MNRLLKFLFLFSLLLGGNALFAQIRIEVIGHPRFLLKDSSLFISGTFNEWSPGDENYKLIRRNDGVYYFDLPDTLDNFEYKFTQGGWAFVEGTSEGRILPNRIYNSEAEPHPKLIQVVIEGWETQPAYTFIVTKVPDNTPFDAALYIMGNFNNWNPSDKNYKLRKQIDGTYRIIVYSDVDKIEYKFTRGTMKSVEGRRGGKLMSNRVAERSTSESKTKIEIADWEDISSGPQLYSAYDLMLLFSVFQGLLLIITIPTIQEYNREANRWLLLLIGFTSAILLIKVVADYPEIEHALPKLQLIPDFILFIYAPLFYFYIQKLLFQSQYETRIFYFVPVIAQFFLYMVYFLLDQSVFQSKLVDPTSELHVIRFATTSVALVFNVYYWILSQRSITLYKVNYQNSNSYEQNLQYLSTVLFIQAACLIGWFVTFLLEIFGWSLSWHISDLIEISIESIWIVFSMITFFLGYFVIHEPNIFRLPNTVSQANKLAPVELDNHVIDYLNNVRIEKEEDDIEMDHLKERLIACMEKDKPFTNPKLTLIELSARLKIQPHVLSKVINSGFGINFFDFINSYRIEEFKKRVEDPHFRNYTLLGIAFDVGFNSKTAFNRSFKKITNQTPSAFFNNLRE